MPWPQASCLHDMPQLQFAGGATQILFVSRANAKQSKKRLKTSVEWKGWCGSLAVALPQQQATNDLLHHNWHHHLTSWLFLILTLACMSMDASTLPPQDAHCNLLAVLSHTCFLFESMWRTQRTKSYRSSSTQMGVALLQQVSWMSCCNIDQCHHCIGWLFLDCNPTVHAADRCSIIKLWTNMNCLPETVPVGIHTCQCPLTIRIGTRYYTWYIDQPFLWLLIHLIPT